MLDGIEPVVRSAREPRVAQRQLARTERDAPDAGIPTPERPAERGVASRADALASPLARAVAARSIAPQRTAGRRLLQRLVRTERGAGTTLHVRWGDAIVNVEAVPVRSDPPVLIEVMEPNKESAIAKVRKVAAVNAAPGSQSRIAIAIALNAKAKAEHIEKNGRLKATCSLDAYTLAADCAAVGREMQTLGVIGSCFPAVWGPTDPKSDVYVFPFLEMRARVTLHPGTRTITALLSEHDAIVRSMDADVSDDPLLEGRVGGAQLADFAEMDESITLVASGGYNWDPSPRSAEWWGLVPPARKGKPPPAVKPQDVPRLNAYNMKWARILVLINEAEHERRRRLTDVDATLVYWPEPNAYTSARARLRGAEEIMGTPGHQTKDSQMRESVHYLKDPASKSKLLGSYDRVLTTTKPVKNYLDWLRDLILAARVPDLDTIVEHVEGIRQTHLSPSHIEDIQKESWYGVKSPLSDDMKRTLEAERYLAVQRLATQIRAVLSS